MIKIQKQQRSVGVDMDGTGRRSSKAAMDGVGAELPTGAMSANIRAAMLQAQEDAAEGRSVQDDLDDYLDDLGGDDGGARPAPAKKSVAFSGAWSTPAAAGLQNSTPIFTVAAP